MNTINRIKTPPTLGDFKDLPYLQWFQVKLFNLDQKMIIIAFDLH